MQPGVRSVALPVAAAPCAGTSQGSHGSAPSHWLAADRPIPPSRARHMRCHARRWPARAADRTHQVPPVFVPLPLRAPLGKNLVARLARAHVGAHAFPSWLILEAQGPFRNGRDALAATASLLGRASPALAPHAPAANAFLQQLFGAACNALVRLHAGCD